MIIPQKTEVIIWWGIKNELKIFKFMKENGLKTISDRRNDIQNDEHSIHKRAFLIGPGAYFATKFRGF